MSSKKIVCLGGGSRYFIRALGDIAVTEGLAGSEITLYDIDMEKAEIMAQHGTRLAEESGLGMTVRAAKVLADAVDSADFAVSSIGGAGASIGGIYGTEAHISDILIPARYGVFQVVGDTGGPAGMMMGLRSIPIYIDICREMEKRCPDAILMNHSNPMAPLCRAIEKYTNIKVIGVCHGVQGGIKRIARLLGVEPHELDCVWIGTNHYHWFVRILHKRVDVYPLIRQKLQERIQPEGEQMTQKLSAVYRHEIVYPPDDHAFEFYPFTARLSDVEEVPYGFSEELKAVTDSCGVRGIYIGDAPMSLKGILEKRIAWQELVVDAAVTGNENLALQALLLDEMAILPEKAEQMLTELLIASKEMLPQFSV